MPIKIDDTIIKTDEIIIKFDEKSKENNEMTIKTMK